MNKQELNRYKELHGLVGDISKVVLGNDETDSVKEYFANEENRNHMKRRLKCVSEIEDIDFEISKRNKKNDINRLEQRIKQTQEIRMKRRGLIRGIISISVAAALIAVSFVVYDNSNNNITDVVSSISENINTTETEGVKIIHSNGEVEVLNSDKRIAINGIDIAQVDGNSLKYNNSVIDSAVISTIVIPKMNRYTVVLEDGTEVYLSANSTLKYPSKFVGKNREVELTGEAYFNVTKSEKPFNVKVLGVEVCVYGTEFVINSYNKNKITTALFSGSVGVKYNVNNSMKEVKIVPNQRLIVNSDNGDTTLDQGINVLKYRSWVDGFFRSDEEPLKDLLHAVGNWYEVEFEFDDELIGNKLVSASLDSRMSLDSILKMLEISTNIKIKEEGGIYIVK